MYLAKVKYQVRERKPLHSNHIWGPCTPPRVLSLFEPENSYNPIIWVGPLYGER